MYGGEHHSIALDNEGNVYSFGRNDNGELGLGENVTDRVAEEDKKG